MVPCPGWDLSSGWFGRPRRDRLKDRQHNPEDRPLICPQLHEPEVGHFMAHRARGLKTRQPGLPNCLSPGVLPAERLPAAIARTEVRLGLAGRRDGTWLTS